MKKIHMLALAAVVSLGIGASALPASAATIASCQDSTTNARVPGDGDTSQIDTMAPNILQALKAKGINATSVSDWGGCVEASVVKHNGTVANEFFDPSSLQRLSRG